MVEINLLPREQRRSTRPDAWKYGTAAVLGLSLLLVALGEARVGGRLGALRDEQAQLQGEIAALQGAKTEYDGLVAEQRTLEGVTAVAQQLRSNKTYWTNDLAAFSAQLPSGGGVALTSMTVRPLDAAALGNLQQTGVYAGKNVVREFDLSGTARSQQSVVNFLNAFENSPSFAVNFRGVQREGDSDLYTFTASVGLVGEPPATPADAAAPAPAPEGTPAPEAPPADPVSGGEDRRGGGHG
ncbi:MULTISPECIES: fimbrial assembly protein [Deinococcus]|uniref:fimbrial assembly protein n=1 Tax=Deinococcus TaxID=1298 RepID=UPI0004845412|nr:MULTISPECIES: fimbrial assembly protein [Deinococcus]KEF34256.1 fimbrial assembly protein [Deinococcus sp. RL]